MNSFVQKLVDKHLVWLDYPGIGYLKNQLPEDVNIYDQAYFDKYVKMEGTDMGQAIIQSRINLIRKYAPDVFERSMYHLTLVDVGIGAGGFVTTANCMGYDINPIAVKWLQDNGRWLDLMHSVQRPHTSLCFWDSLEHIDQPDYLLSMAADYVFISMPIYTSLQNVQTSKHFRPNEHIWYFTEMGLVYFMNYHGFQLIGKEPIEMELGREAIWQYAFRRVSNGPGNPSRWNQEHGARKSRAANGGAVQC